MVDRHALGKGEIHPHDTLAFVNRVIGVIGHAFVHFVDQRISDRPSTFLENIRMMLRFPSPVSNRPLGPVTPLASRFTTAFTFSNKGWCSANASAPIRAVFF